MNVICLGASVLQRIGAKKVARANIALARQWRGVAHAKSHFPKRLLLILKYRTVLKKFHDYRRIACVSRHTLIFRMAASLRANEEFVCIQNLSELLESYHAETCEHTHCCFHQLVGLFTFVFLAHTIRISE